jgi:hypothetical protein
MSQRSPIGRLLSPAGFGLVLIFFLLPFLTVSCGTGEEKIQSTFSGVDMAVGTSPDIVGPGVEEDVADQLGVYFAEDLDLEPLALLAALAVLAGMAANLIRERLARHGMGTGLAVLSAALLVAAVLRAPGRVDSAFKKLTEGSTLTDPIHTEVHTRYGFWLAIIALGALAAGHATMLVLSWRAPHPQPERSPEPGHAPEFEFGPEPERAPEP